jgi:hypothetical protein
MQKIKNVTELKSAIQQLEYRSRNELVLLKRELFNTYESLKPINIIKSTLKEFYLAPDLKATILKTVINIATGFVARKIFINKRPNIITKLLGLGYNY